MFLYFYQRCVRGGSGLSTSSAFQTPATGAFPGVIGLGNGAGLGGLGGLGGSAPWGTHIQPLISKATGHIVQVISYLHIISIECCLQAVEVTANDDPYGLKEAPKTPQRLPVERKSPVVDGALARSQARFRPAQEVTPDHRFKCQGEFTADKLVWRGRAKGLPMLKVPAEIPLDDAPVTDLQQSEIFEPIRSALLGSASGGFGASTGLGATTGGLGVSTGLNDSALLHSNARHSPVPLARMPRDLATPPESPVLPVRAAPRSDDLSRAPVSTDKNVSTIPPIEQLQGMTVAQLGAVRDFQIIHREFGTCLWPGETDVLDLNLDSVVRFERKRIQVYPVGNPPGVGHKLNKLTQVTLHGVWPKNQKSGSLSKLKDKLRNISKSTFVSYENGSWTFTTPDWCAEPEDSN